MSLTKFLFLLTLNYFSVYGLEDTNCISNLECYDSACCRNNVCVSNNICNDDKNKIYLYVGLVGIFFLLVTMIYFFMTIKASRENVKKINHEFKAANE